MVIFMRLTEKLVFPHGNDESAPSILMGWRAAATSFEPQPALPPVATRNGPAQPMRIGAGTASEETAKLEASGWGWVHRCFRSIKFPPEIPEEPIFCPLGFLRKQREIDSLRDPLRKGNGGEFTPRTQYGQAPRGHGVFLTDFSEGTEWGAVRRPFRTGGVTDGRTRHRVAGYLPGSLRDSR